MCFFCVQLLDKINDMEADVQRSRAVADKAKASHDKLKAERDHHRLSHRRIVHDKNKLVAEMKRLGKRGRGEVSQATRSAPACSR